MLNKFQIRFPEATAIDWTKNDEAYGVEFEVGKMEHKVVLDSGGTILRMQKEILFSELPKAVRATISRNHKSANRDGAEIIIISGKSYYQVKLERFRINDKIIFDENGKRMGKRFFRN